MIGLPFTCPVYKKSVRDLVNNAASNDVTFFPLVNKGGGVGIRTIFDKILKSTSNLAMV